MENYLERNQSLLKIDSEMAERENRNSSLPLEVDTEWFDPEANTILPNDLLIMMEEYKNDMLIIDIRPREWFDNEQMKTDVLTLNIEQYTLLTCHNPSDFTMLLCFPTRSKFHSLASVRFIILLDFAFDLRDAQQIETWGSTLQHLKQILPSNCQSALLKVLIGGWLNFRKLFPDQVMHVRQDAATAYDEFWEDEDEYDFSEDEDDDTENDENVYVEEDDDDDDSDDQSRNDNRRNNNVANNRYNNYGDDDDDSDSDAPHNTPLILRRGRTEHSLSRGRPRGASLRGRSRDSPSPVPRIMTLSCTHRRCRNSFYRTCVVLPPKTVVPLEGRRSIFPGLVNYKASCSMNSVISCLYASVEFRNYIVHHWSRISVSVDFKFLREFCKLIYEMRDRSIINIIPADLLTTTRMFLTWPRKKRAEEVYQILLRRLHEDFEREGLVLNSSSSARGEMTTIIEQLFAYSVFERTTFTCCGMVEVGSPTFNILLNILFSQFGSVQTLEDSLELFRNSPFLHHCHGVACPRCKTSVFSVVETRFSSLPTYLVINVDSHQRNVSLRICLEDPLHIPLDENGVERTVSYKLYAMVECIRENSITHYVSVCRDSQTGDWFYLDGHEIKEVACDYIPKKPCILFYEKCHPYA
ncbi:Ubiquitin carboxyl-terminal hydrolase [Trichinella spiralis]|uniref:ubiquitinyl hydrolase 1 n=1 Tax=Trichinella spiralis TaxID=6334 RepID=A0ABR3L0L3_TRISP